MKYWDLYKDVWNFHKKFSEIKDTNEYWQAVIDESEQIAKKYNNQKFVNDLLIVVISELERSYKEMRADANAGI